MNPTQVLEKLKNAGLNLEPYKNPPLGSKDLFCMSKNRSGSGIRIWFSPVADYEISTDSKRKQAVVTVVEKPRDIPNENVWNDRYGDDRRGISLKYSKKIRKYLEKFGNSWVPIAEFRKANTGIGVGDGHPLRTVVPNSTYKMTHVKLNYTRPSKGRIHILVSTKGVSRIGKTTMCFLIGVDEGNYFISLLKKKVRTVLQAHRELLPKELRSLTGSAKSGLKRQGEWFFVPVNGRMNLKLFKNFKEEKFFHSNQLESGSSHSASINVLSPRGWKNTRYVLGIITDSREGYHGDLLLEGWHKAVRNNEVELPSHRQIQKYD